MKQAAKVWRITTLIIALCAVHSVLYAADNYVKISLPKGVSIELPKNWIVLSEDQKIILDLAVESGLDLSGVGQEDSELPFAANYYDDKGNTLGLLNVRYYPQFDLTQADAQSASAQDISGLDAVLKKNLIPFMKAVDMEVTAWAGTQKITINGITVLLTEYKRKYLNESREFRVRLVRVLDADRSFTLTVSYHEAASLLLGPITDRIISSLRIERLSPPDPGNLDSSASKQDHSGSSRKNSKLKLFVEFVVFNSIVQLGVAFLAIGVFILFLGRKLVSSNIGKWNRIGAYTAVGVCAGLMSYSNYTIPERNLEFLEGATSPHSE